MYRRQGDVLDDDWCQVGRESVSRGRGVNVTGVIAERRRRGMPCVIVHFPMATAK
jgi:hypothetical protein